MSTTLPAGGKKGYRGLPMEGFLARAGVAVAFQHGDAAALPFEQGSFDFVVCRAAFKNFAEPVRALGEMHRVLRPGGKAAVSLVK